MTVGVQNLHQPFRHARCRLQRIGEALGYSLLHYQAIDYLIDVVLLLLVESGRFSQLDHLAVDDGASETLLHHLQHLLAVFALLAADVWRQDGELRGGRQGEQPIDHLLNRLRPDLLPAVRAVRDADRCVEQPQVVVDLGDRADRGPRISRSRSLLDGNRRREAFDRIDVRLLHLLQELPGVGR